MINGDDFGIECQRDQESIIKNNFSFNVLFRNGFFLLKYTIELIFHLVFGMTKQNL